MKRVAVCWLALAVVATTTAKAYQVFEEPEENDETNRGKRQQSGTAVIDSIFNIPITAIQQTSAAAQTFRPENAATIDSVLKIPVSTLQAVGALIKNRQQNRETSTTPYRPPRRLQRRYETPTPATYTTTTFPSSTSTSTQQPNDPDQRYRDEIYRRVQAQRERQRLYEEQLERRRFQQLQRYTRRMEQGIAAEDSRTHHGFYRDPFGFNALTKWIVGPHGVFNGHAGHGDGHVYQFFNPAKPLHFGGQPQGPHHPTPTRPPHHGSTSTVSTTTTTGSSSTSTSTTTTSTNRPHPTHGYEVHENVDEGVNPFAWPKWFGIINSLVSQQQQPPLQNKIAPKQKIRFDEPPLQNKIAPKDEENLYYKNKYAQARKNLNAPEEEPTGNEIDGEVAASGENRFEREGRVLFPSK